MPSLKMTRRTDSEYNVNLSKRRNWYSPEGDPPITPPTPPVVPPVPPPAPELKFSQDDVNNVVGNRVKEATTAARKALLKELGIENVDDPDAVKTVKGKLTAAQLAEEAQLTATQKLERERDAAINERDTAKAERAALAQERNVDHRNEAVKEALTTARCTNATKVMALMSVMQADELKATLKDDGTVDKAALTKLVEAAKKEHKEYFTGTGPGIPSNNGGRNQEPGKPDFGTKSTVHF